MSLVDHFSLIQDDSIQIVGSVIIDDRQLQSMSMSPVFLPPKVKPSQSCERCGHWYDLGLKSCHHCLDLTDAQAQALRARLQQRKRADSSLGGLFLFIAAMVAMAVLLAIVLT